MPYKLQWFPAPKDLSIKVIPGDEKTPPLGFQVRVFSFGVLEASIPLETLINLPEVERHPTNYYHCNFCGGWIEGFANHYEVNTLAPLSGRKGDVYHCRRCGNEIGFFGMVS